MAQQIKELVLSIITYWKQTLFFLKTEWLTGQKGDLITGKPHNTVKKTSV